MLSGTRCLPPPSPPPSLQKSYPGVDASDRPFLCANLVYCHQLLERGFNIPRDSLIMLVKKLVYRGQARDHIEA